MLTYLDHDSLIVIFENLPMAEKLKCRLVCQQWRDAIDKMIAGQQFLEICAVNSSVVAAAVEATGLPPFSVGNKHSALQVPLNTLARYLKQFWSSVNSKIIFSSSSSANLTRPVMTGDTSHSALGAALMSSSELDLLNVCTPASLIYLSSYYWTYAFCASSSLFSSYSFAISTITTHEYFHSFCDCYPRQRHKYSVMLDRQNITFETFNRVLSKFANVTCLVVRNVDQLSDLLLFMITHQCRNVQSLSFTNCSGVERRTDESGHAPLHCLTDYGWRLMSLAYPDLTSLTLRQCKLTEEQLTKVIKNCTSLRFLDISDNISIGKSVRYLGDKIECLICGDLSNDESIENILSNVAFGNGRHLKYLSIFGALGSLKSFIEFDQLSKLELHFYTDEELPNYLSEIGILCLTSLVLEQIRCYESPSAINHIQFEQMLKKSSNLRRLQITGDFDWNLRLNDESLRTLTKLCPRLQELTLNGNGSISDYGLIHLSSLPLVQLSLSSFSSVTDYSIKALLKKIGTLQQVTLVDMPQITETVISKAISICVSDQGRKINLTLSDEQMNKRLKRQRQYLNCPSNLVVNFDSHLCGKQLADSEPTDVQMILVVLMSALILGMTLLTTVVVILVPLSMLLIMAHDYILDTFFSRFDFTDYLLNSLSTATNLLTSTTCDTQTILTLVRRFIFTITK